MGLLKAQCTSPATDGGSATLRFRVTVVEYGLCCNARLRVMTGSTIDPRRWHHRAVMTAKPPHRESPRIQVRFRQSRAQYCGSVLRMTVGGRDVGPWWRYKGPYDDGPEWVRPVRSISCPLDDTLCPLPKLLKWLEAVSCDAPHCAVYFDEGPSSLHFEWQSGILRIEVWEHATRHSPGAHRRFKAGNLDCRQVAISFYSAFRNFVQSPEYNPAAYEQHSTDSSIVWVASMRPRRIRRGNVAVTAATPWSTACFNEAAANSPRKRQAKQGQTPVLWWLQ